MAHGGGRCRCCGEAAAGGERGAAWGLHLRIDRQRLQCLNERREGSGALVFRAWEERGDRAQFVESDDEAELLFNIPFTGNVKLKGVMVVGEDDGTHPAEMRLIARFCNVYHLSIHFPRNFGAETTKIFYIGLKGEWTEAQRHEVTICSYEAAANPADHRLEQITPQTHFIS
ncbi:PITH domain-containing protein 1 isoform 2-T2 [Chlamydotis macqueenii]